MNKDKTKHKESVNDDHHRPQELANEGDIKLRIIICALCGCLKSFNSTDGYAGEITRYISPYKCGCSPSGGNLSLNKKNI